MFCVSCHLASKPRMLFSRLHNYVEMPTLRTLLRRLAFAAAKHRIFQIKTLFCICLYFKTRCFSNGIAYECAEDSANVTPGSRGTGRCRR